MFGLHEFIKQRYKDFTYSKPYYAKSKLDSVTGLATVSLALSQQGAAVILIHSIQWDLTANAGLNSIVVTFSDSVNQVLLRQWNSSGYNNKQHFGYYQENSELVVNSDSALITFVVEYQFLIKPKGK